MTSSTGILSGKGALVTGGGSGIGLHIARYLLRDGASVTICGRTADKLQAAAAQLEAEAHAGSAVQWIAADVSDEDQVAAAVARAAEPEGGLHLAVANAGGGSVGPFLWTSKAEWDGVIGGNLTGTFLTFKHAGAAIVRSGGGSMVAISSLAGHVVHPYMAPYCASKAGIDMLVKVAADELGRADVRVNSVQPGIVSTELMDPVMGMDDMLAEYLPNMPLGRVGDVDDVASAVRFLLGPESGWLTGVNLPLDGGHHLRGGPSYEPIARLLYGDAVDSVAPPT
ncbi:MAG: SDR family oxidoreductase [Acidimicrobiales bacterium]|jgi:NAD(P)-dependent dehydrogenase (short-subunit alcohol dehydrogenase family)|nr:SDR family oxidoreductase [Acidimicrobiales bacterium]